MQLPNLKALHLVILGAAGLAIAASPAAAQSRNSFGDPNSATFGNRTEKSDGSVAMSIGRRLPTQWETKVGVDASLAPDSTAPGMAPYGLNGSSSSSGALWGSMSGPSVAPLVYDKTAIDARVDSGKEQGKVGATLSRTVPLGNTFSVTVRDNYSVTQSLQSEAHVSGAPQSMPATSVPAWNIDRSLSLNLRSTGTTLSAGRATSSGDPQWHNKLSAEQKVFGPLSVTTSITDPGTTASNKSISAGFKHTW
jgi:hypothetical protein